MNEFQIIPGGIDGPMSSVSTRPVVTPQRVYVDMEDERVQEVISRVQRTVLASYPDAEFVSYIGTNPLGIYIETYTREDHFLGILKLLEDKLGNLHIAAGIDVCVLPRQKAREQAA